MESEKAHHIAQISVEGRGRRGAWFFLALLPVVLIASPARAADPESGKLLFLVARSQIRDPYFAQSVILMLPLEDHSIEVGLILNKTSQLPLSKLFPESSAIAARTDPIRFGGPVDVEVPGLIFHSAKPPEDSSHLYGDVYLVFGAYHITSLVPNLPPDSKMLFFLGRAQWAPAQLAGEIRHGDWERKHEDGGMIFTADPKTLWHTLSEGGEPGKYIRYKIPPKLLQMVQSPPGI